MQAANEDAHPFSWLWENSAWADFTVDVLPPEAGPDTAPLYSLQLHTLVVASASPGHFRGHCTRQRADGTGADGPRVGAKRRAPDSDSQEGNAYAYRLTLAPGEPEGMPKAVLCHLYTGALPDDPAQLIWMLRRADYLDLAGTVRASLHKLSSIGSKQLTLQHAVVLHSLPDLQCGIRQGEVTGQPAAAPAAAAAGPSSQTAAGPDTPAVVAAGAAATAVPVPATGTPAQAAVAAPAPAKTAAALLQELIDSLLLAHLPSAPAIVTDAALLAQFTQLPLVLVKRWVELDKYEVDSGNTLAVLFTAWHNEQPSREHCKQLTAMLPVLDVTYGFHAQALEPLGWWWRDVSTLTAHRLAERYPKNADLQKFWRGSLKGATVGERAARRKDHTWTLTTEQIKQLWRDKALRLPSFYFMGYQLGVRLALNYSQEDTGKTGPVFLSLWLTMDWPLALRPHLQEPVINGLSDAFNFDITWGEPGRHYGERFWLDEWGMRYLSRENLRFDTQDALLAKLAAPAFYIKCDVGLEGSEKDV